MAFAFIAANGFGVFDFVCACMPRRTAVVGIIAHAFGLFAVVVFSSLAVRFTCVVNDFITAFTRRKRADARYARTFNPLGYAFRTFITDSTTIVDIIVLALCCTGIIMLFGTTVRLAYIADDLIAGLTYAQRANIVGTYTLRP